MEGERESPFLSLSLWKPTASRKARLAEEARKARLAEEAKEALRAFMVFLGSQGSQGKPRTPRKPRWRERESLLFSLSLEAQEGQESQAFAQIPCKERTNRAEICRICDRIRGPSL